jgi:hypothetical protein
MGLSQGGFNFIDDISGDGQRMTKMDDSEITPVSCAIWWMQQWRVRTVEHFMDDRVRHSACFVCWTFDQPALSTRQ